MVSDSFAHLTTPEPGLLPTKSLSGDQFEDFFERLLDSHRFAPEVDRHVVWVERWGRKGDKQHGIDFIGRWSNGSTVDWQCKRWKRLQPADVRKIIGDCKMKSSEHHIVFSGEASAAVRAEIKKRRGWSLLDQRGLTRMFRELPRNRQRDLLDATWGVAVRRLLMDSPDQDTWDSLLATSTRFGDPENLLMNPGDLQGRVGEMQALLGAADSSLGQPWVVTVSGPGGSGKSRLLFEAAKKVEETTYSYSCVLACTRSST